ncbi:MAG: hypothetical protein KCHDKBKB_00270 [Elusimicrobia bacterium]|nr:hypothetical protein [Elusimicrobiota bacterium]
MDKNEDDYRTTETAFGFRVTNNLFLNLNLSALTDKGPTSQNDLAEEGRIDQMTLSFSRRWIFSKEKEGDAREFLFGVVLRRTGELNGAAIQNGIHEVIQNNPVNLAYEDISRLDLGPLVSFNYFSHLDRKNKWGMWFPIQGLVTTAGQAELSAGAYGSWHPKKVTLYTGFRGEARSAGDTGHVVDNTFHQEEGVYSVIGFKAGPVALDLGHKIGSTYGYGWLTLLEDDSVPAPSSDDRGHDIVLSLGAEVPYFGVRSDLAWLAPSRWSWSPKWRWGLTSVFTGGEMPKDAPEGWDEFQRSLTVGPAAHYYPGWEGLPGASLMAEIRLGRRQEGFLVPNQTTTGDVKSNQDVLAGDLALVIPFGGVPQKGLAMKIGVTAWKPLSGSEEVILGTEQITIMEPQIQPFVTFDYGFSF